MTLVVFTDLDGTLLDHATYSFQDALPAIQTLKELDIPLVLASSKTAAEIVPLQSKLGMSHQLAIVENGAGIHDPKQPCARDTGEYDRLRAALDTLPAALRSGFIGFGDMHDADVAAATGLSPAASALARQRRYSEPGLWTGTAEDHECFLQAMMEHGVHARQGGRFLTLSFGHTKADRAREIARRLAAEVSIALGDAPNDIELLQTADYGIVIRNDHSPDVPLLAGEAEGRIRRTVMQGPRAWNTAVLDILRELGLRRD